MCVLCIHMYVVYLWLTCTTEYIRGFDTVVFHANSTKILICNRHREIADTFSFSKAFPLQPLQPGYVQNKRRKNRETPFLIRMQRSVRNYCFPDILYKYYKCTDKISLMFKPTGRMHKYKHSYIFYKTTFVEK